MAKQPGRPRGAAQLGARQLALTALERVLHGAYLAPTLSSLLDAAELEGPERALATDLAYGVVRRLPQLDAALAPLLTAPRKLPPRVLGALRLGAFELNHRGTPAYAAVSAWVGLVKREAPKLAGLVNAVLRRVRPLPDDAPRAVRAALPAWLLGAFDRALGEERAFEAALGMLEPEPLWLTALSEAAVEALTADGAEVVPLFPDQPARLASLRVRAGAPLDSPAAYRRGLVQPQNPSSLEAARLLGAGPDDTVYDLASGRGVKSAVLAASGAEVTAFELDARRSQAAAQNLRRLGLEVEHRQADLRALPEAPPVSHVILDAPCSGTGTLRGHPEIKLRVTQAQVDELAALQRVMLRNAARLVAPGGVLVYAVCSLTREEGAEVVADLLEERPDFRPEPVDTRLPSVPPANGGVGRYLLPLGGLDGFYLARLRRRPLPE